MKVHTEALHFKADSKLLSFIETRLNRMDRFYDRLMDAQVRLKLENSGQVKDKVAEVRINVPGDVLYVKTVDKTFEAAIDMALVSLKKQLERYKDRLRS